MHCLCDSHTTLFTAYIDYVRKVGKIVLPFKAHVLLSIQQVSNDLCVDQQ